MVKITLTIEMSKKGLALSLVPTEENASDAELGIGIIFRDRIKNAINKSLSEGKNNYTHLGGVSEEFIKKLTDEFHDR